MDDDTRNIFGCIGLVILALLVGLAFRAHNFKEWIVMAVLVIVFFVTALGSIALFASEGCSNKFWGANMAVLALICAYSVGSFLITRDYSRATSPWRARSKATPTPAQVAGVTPLPTATQAPSATPTFAPTSTPIPGGITTTDLKWIRPEVLVAEPAVVAGTLNEINKLEGGQAAAMASYLRLNTPGESTEGRYAALLFTAFAHVRAGELGAARDVYNLLIKETPGSPFGASAAYAVRFTEQTDQSEKAMDKLYQELWKQPVLPGWYLTPAGWQYTNSRVAASLQLIDLRSDQLSFRLFSFLHERSTFPKPYAYLFIFLAVMLVARLITLPLQIRSARLGVQMRRLQPEIQMLQLKYAYDAAKLQQEMMRLYRDHGVNIWNGCLSSVVDLVFVIWMFVAAQSFAPQLFLDGSRLWWASDVTGFNLVIVLLWIGLTIVQGVLTYVLQGQMQNIPQGFISGLVFAIIIGVLAYFLKWPAYIFILYGMLTLSALIVSLVLLPIALATTKD